MPRRRVVRAAGVACLLALFASLTACTSGEAPSERESSGAPDPTASGGGSASGRTEGAARQRLPSVEELPRRWGEAGSDPGAWPSPPLDASGLPSVLDDPAPAILAHHVPERFGDPKGWGSEVVLFLGRDRVWRSLDLGDLGLDASWWPGPDTYGSGALSDDGLAWAGETNAGVVLVDLAAGTSRHVPFPRSHPVVRGADWVPGRDVLSAYSRAATSRAYRTFHVTRGGRVTPVAYDGSRTTFDADGTPVQVRRTRPRELEVVRLTESGRETSRWEARLAWPSWPLLATLGADAVALPGRVDGRSRPGTAVWVLDSTSGEPRARLHVPAGTEVVGWRGRSLLLLVGEQDLVAWTPGTGRSERLLTLPRSAAGGYAAITVTLAG